MKSSIIENDVGNLFDFESTTINTEETPVEMNASEQQLPMKSEEKGFNWEEMPIIG